MSETKDAASPTGKQSEPKKRSQTSQSTKNTQDDSEGPRFWLMKAEPQSRFEKGIDVKFSIDDLKNAKEPEPWDGAYLLCTFLIELGQGLTSSLRCT